MNQKITREIEKEIISYYKEKPISISTLANHFKICESVASKVLKKNGLKPYTKVQLFSPNLDEHYFDTINTKEKAYFLGLITTDGCIYQKKGRSPLVSLVLQDKDSYLIEKFKEEIKSNKAVTHDGRGCSEINIVSAGLVKGLKQYGLTERKSLCVPFPTNIPKHLLSHYFRGLIDGDGSIAFYSRKGRKVHAKAIRFCKGSLAFIEDFIKALDSELNIGLVYIRKEKENLWSVAYRRNESLTKIIDYLYKDATIFMKRKKYICDLILQEIYGNTEITISSNELMAS